MFTKPQQVTYQHVRLYDASIEWRIPYVPIDFTHYVTSGRGLFPAGLLRPHILPILIPAFKVQDPIQVATCTLDMLYIFKTKF